MASSLVLLTAQAAALDDLLPCRRESGLWFSDLPADLELAKAYRRPCPMRRVCLAGAVERREPHGVWGGEIFTRGAIIPEKRRHSRPSKLRRVIGTGARGIVSPPEMSRETPLSRQPR